MKTVRRPPYPKWNPGYFPCSSLTTLPLSSRRPSVSFGGFGLTLNAAETDLAFGVTVDIAQLSGPITNAHIHRGVAGVPGGVAFGLTFVNGYASGNWPLTPADVAELKAGGLYFNIHTGLNGSGELRGQIGPATGLEGAAGIGPDYVGVAGGLLTIPAAGTTATIMIDIGVDSDYELDEQFRVKLSNPVNAAIGEAYTIVTIRNDDAPVANDDAFSAEEDTALVVNGVLDNDSLGGAGLQAVLVDPPANGDVVLIPDGSFIYSPDEDFNGTDAFTYEAVSAPSDGRFFRSSPANVDITVNEVNDDPVAENDIYAVPPAAATVSVAFADGVRVNDADVDDDPLFATIVDPPQAGAFDNFSLSPNGSFFGIYSAGFSGNVSFTYRVTDGRGGVSNVATVVLAQEPTFVMTAPENVGETDGSFDVKITLFNPGAGDSSVDFDTTDDTATAGQDYTTKSLTVTLNASNTMTTITVPVLDDAIREGPRATLRGTVQSALEHRLRRWWRSLQSGCDHRRSRGPADRLGSGRPGCGGHERHNRRKRDSLVKTRFEEVPAI